LNIVARKNHTAIYLLCFHSQKPVSFNGSQRQFLIVERAISEGKWPYDNGDDPSFYVARKGGSLTWCVCRQEVRNSIPVGSLVAFFSFTSLQDGHVLYRLCGVTTVIGKIDVRALHSENDFATFRHLYINSVIRPDLEGWRYDETDRPASQRHGDWLWRISDHRGLKQEIFNKRYEQIYRSGFLPESSLANGDLTLAQNYVVFSTGMPNGYISGNPPEVAIARKGAHEKWSDKTLRSLTVGTAARFLTSKRSYLRVVNKSGRNVHRHIRFMMPSDEAVEWRDELIRALKAATARGPVGPVRARGTATARCSAS
jgi:hypothetical protein